MVSLSSLGAQSDYIKSFARVKNLLHHIKTAVNPDRQVGGPVIQKNVFVEVLTICGSHVFIFCVLVVVWEIPRSVKIIHRF